MLRTVETIQGPILANYTAKERRPGVEIKIRRNTFIQVVATEEEMDLNPQRSEGESVKSIKIPASVIKRYQWIERGLVKEVTFKTETVAVTDEGKIITENVDIDQTQKGYQDNYNGIQDESIVKDRLSQDSSDMESSVDASAVIERKAEQPKVDSSIVDQIDELAAEESKKASDSKASENDGTGGDDESSSDDDLNKKLEEEKSKNQGGKKNDTGF